MLALKNPHVVHKFCNLLMVRYRSLRGYLPYFLGLVALSECDRNVCLMNLILRTARVTCHLHIL